MLNHDGKGKGLTVGSGGVSGEVLMPQVLARSLPSAGVFFYDLSRGRPQTFSGGRLRSCLLP
jgi:hypothetical protein